MNNLIEQLRAVLRYPKYRKLLAVRLVSQAGDGMFQVGLATLFFFNPQNATTAGDVAVAFAVLLLPFTVVGPFAGPLLDRWSRRNVLHYANLVRAGLTVVLAVLVYFSHWLVYVLALVTLGVNRFLLSGLSAGQPHTLPKHLLVMANSITPTLGSVSAAVGAAAGLVLNFASEGLRNTIALLLAAVLFTVAALLALRLGEWELGPDEKPTTSLSDDFRRVLGQMGEAVGYLTRRGTPMYGLGIMAIHRFLYAVNFIALLLISRNLLSDPLDAEAGLATFALVGGISIIGNGLAIVLTPTMYKWVSPPQWIMVCLGLSVVSQALLIVTYRAPLIFVSAVLLGLGVQGAKIAVDTIVQADTADAYRGRAFALYDMMYNAAFVGAAFLAALTLPDTGWSPAVFAGLTVAYVLAAAWYWRKMKAIDFEPRGV
ncbi:MFS transporter [Trueperella bialowiezensis]|uniref:2-acyl-glycerophospho-ethanolamine acyltransferase n=1 Tax=Trueperella bialowiezensis TaxID=312285 RepID=A0A3S4Z5D6_9ACTO|nr:MFS transporter [Trueperella bialowiezensis]VEI13332.1 2-acyl-glycerophospho-ethanolamine acyltransferase [Trueperella bialowiezensis]